MYQEEDCRLHIFITHIVIVRHENLAAIARKNILTIRVPAGDPSRWRGKGGSRRSHGGGNQSEGKRSLHSVIYFRSSVLGGGIVGCLVCLVVYSLVGLYVQKEFGGGRVG
jgi:hypothetical protein